MSVFETRRRALLAGGGFPSNYLFKSGLGFRKDVEYALTSTSPDTCNITKDRIYLEGKRDSVTGVESSGIIYIGSKIEYDQYKYGTITYERLLSNPILNDNFNKICFHFNVVQSNNTRPAFINLINCSNLPNSKIVKNQSSTDKPTSSSNAQYYYSPNAVNKLLGITTADGEYTISLDISTINDIMISLWSGNWTGKSLTIYDIWFE